MTDQTPPSTMKAWLYNSATGGLEKNLTLSQSARTPGAPKSNQVLVQVLSAALNPADYKVPEMGLITKVIISTPASPGIDYCGRVASVGPGVTEFQPGQLVFGCLGKPNQFGPLAEYVIADATAITHLPEGVEPDHAATIGVAAQTAYMSLAGYVSAGDKVFINGGSGGCGIYAIQIAKLLDCHVTTSCSGKNAQFCKDLGADEVIDYTTQDLVSTLKSHGQVYAHVVDHIGSPADLYQESDSFLKPGKAFVQVGAASVLTFAGRLLKPRFLGGGSRKYHALIFKNQQEQRLKIVEWMRKGEVKAVLDSVFEFEDAVKAYEKLRSGRARGKIIVRVTEK